MPRTTWLLTVALPLFLLLGSTPPDAQAAAQHHPARLALLSPHPHGIARISKSAGKGGLLPTAIRNLHGVGYADDQRAAHSTRYHRIHANERRGRAPPSLVGK